MINSYLKIEKKRDEKGRKYIETKLILTAEERKWGSNMVMIETAGEECGDWRELEKWKVKTRERDPNFLFWVWVVVFYFACRKSVR